jgi:hypothetical protein
MRRIGRNFVWLAHHVLHRLPQVTCREEPQPVLSSERAGEQNSREEGLWALCRLSSFVCLKHRVTVQGGSDCVKDVLACDLPSIILHTSSGGVQRQEVGEVRQAFG